MSNISPEERLRDAVIELNDHARWHRIDLAAQLVHGAYQESYRATHVDWGKRVQIADTEVKRLIINRKEGITQSIILLRWYDQRSMQVVETELVQDWKKAGRTFVLSGEAVKSGPKNVLSDLPEPVTEVDEAWDYPEDYVAPASE